MLRLLPDGASPPPFVVLALPRSRTRWLAEFLSYGPWRCTHEEARHFRSMEDTTSWISQPFSGSAETAVVPFWRLIPNSVRVVVVRRSQSEVEASLRRVMTVIPPNLSSILTRLDAKLDQVTKRRPGVLNVAYHDLATLAGATKVFEHALQLPFDLEWWNVLRDVNIQEPFIAFERYAAAYAKQLEKMRGLAKGAILREITLRPRQTLDGVVFATEPFENFVREHPAILDKHAHVVGEPAGTFWTKNLALLQAISDAGAMQIVTARLNGRMFGYLMTELAQSREVPGRITAVETVFYASSEMPGLGMKLQRETLRLLRARGVAEVWFRAGVRGNGPKTEVMYRRLGAEPSGSLWRLDLSGEGFL